MPARAITLGGALAASSAALHDNQLTVTGSGRSHGTARSIRGICSAPQVWSAAHQTKHHGQRLPHLQGLVFEGRRKGLTPQKAEFARPAQDSLHFPDEAGLQTLVERIQPTALIGAAAKKGIFSEGIVKALCKVGRLFCMHERNMHAAVHELSEQHVWTPGLLRRWGLCC